MFKNVALFSDQYFCNNSYSLSVVTVRVCVADILTEIRLYLKNNVHITLLKSHMHRLLLCPDTCGMAIFYTIGKSQSFEMVILRSQTIKS